MELDWDKVNSADVDELKNVLSMIERVFSMR